MISARHMLDHLKDLLEDAFGEQARLRRYTRDEYPDTRIGVQCNACPWNNTSGYDTNRIINEAFLTSETYPNRLGRPGLRGRRHHLHLSLQRQGRQTMISSHNFLTMDAESLLYVFQSQLRLRIKRNQLDHFTDEQMDLIENNILPDLDKVLSISEQAIPA